MMPTLPTTEYKTELIGQPVDILKPLFPEFAKASDYNYNSNSNKYKMSQKIASRHQGDGYSITIDDIYWLIGDENDYYSFIIVTYNGNIVEFQFQKG